MKLVRPYCEIYYAIKQSLELDLAWEGAPYPRILKLKVVAQLRGLAIIMHLFLPSVMAFFRIESYF